MLVFAYICNMDENKPSWMTIGQAAKYLGVSKDTLRRWEKRGKIKAVRSPSNRRFYTQKQLDSIMGKGSVKIPKTPKIKMDLTEKEKLLIYAAAAFLIALITGVLIFF